MTATLYTFARRFAENFKINFQQTVESFLKGQSPERGGSCWSRLDPLKISTAYTWRTYISVFPLILPKNSSISLCGNQSSLFQKNLKLFSFVVKYKCFLLESFQFSAMANFVKRRNCGQVADYTEVTFMNFGCMLRTLFGEISFEEKTINRINNIYIFIFIYNLQGD